MLLKLSDHEVHVAHSGGEAFEAAKELRPDIGIFDIGMPDLNGYELAERIRHEAWGKGHDPNRFDRLGSGIRPARGACWPASIIT